MTRVLGSGPPENYKFDEGGGQITISGKVRCYQDHREDKKPGPVRIIYSKSEEENKMKMRRKTKDHMERIFQTWNENVGKEMTVNDFHKKTNVPKRLLYYFFLIIRDEPKICSMEVKKFSDQEKRLSYVYSLKETLSRDYFQTVAELTHEATYTQRPQVRSQTISKVTPSKLSNAPQFLLGEDIKVEMSSQQYMKICNKLIEQDSMLTEKDTKLAENKSQISDLLDELAQMKTSLQVATDALADLRKKNSKDVSVDEQVDTLMASLKN